MSMPSQNQGQNQEQNNSGNNDNTDNNYDSCNIKGGEENGREVNNNDVQDSNVIDGFDENNDAQEDGNEYAEESDSSSDEGDDEDEDSNGVENSEDYDENEEGDLNEDDEEESDEDEGNEDDYDEDDGEEEDEDDDSYDNEEHDSYVYNTDQVVQFYNTYSNSRYYATEFYRFLEYFSEEKTKLYDVKNPEELNIKKLMLRPFERKPLNHYRQSRIRDSVVMILDNSGSMDWWTQNLQILASIALARNDITIYVAPNGFIEEKLLQNYKRRFVIHDKIVKSLKGRRIIYVGDFDGANTPIELSWNNDVLWICPEDRYRRFKAHDWVSYDERYFKGVFIRAWNLNEMFEGLKKVTRFNNLWIDFHEKDKYYDD